MKQRKTLILATLVLAFSLFLGAALLQTLRKPSTEALEQAGVTRIGNPSAPVEVIVIEDLLCKNCRQFSLEILPKIQSEFVEKGKVRITLVPVAFLKGSKIVANAAMQVYRSHPDKFFSFVQEAIKNSQEGAVKPTEIIRIATRIGGIDLEKLQLSMDRGIFNKVLDQNLEWARNLMGPAFRTPAIYINGAPGSTFSYLAVRDQIVQTLGQR
jgi:protein-disulfide isomerase